MLYRRTFGIAIAAVAIAAPRAAAQPDAELAEAIRAYDPAASVGRTQSADFNGDGREDVAAVLERNGKSALVIFNRTGSGYRPYALYASLPSVSIELRVVPPGRHRVLGAAGALETTAPSLELVFPGRSSAMYVWGNGRYQVHGTENY
ncbi:MAG TPA: hypothetical protein VJ788_07295 [Gemmatimonadota bacterium]|nr:hypothetical protein [Gemmatimonadota bacterium]